MLISSEEVYEKAFEPSSKLQADDPTEKLSVKDKIFKSMRFYGTHFVGVVFTRCTFHECLFLSAHFEDCAFHECKFIRCNTHKFRLTRTYLDPRSFLAEIFDQKKYPNIGVDLFHTLLKNSVDESQPEFRDSAEYHFRLWQRYNHISYWRKEKGTERWLNVRFYAYWFWNISFQFLFGYGVRVRNILLWTPMLFALVWLYNHMHWADYGIKAQVLADVPLSIKTAFFTLGNMSTFGTADLTPSTSYGLLAVSFQVVLGIGWIALSTAMIVKRFVR
ncbi:hypothetical protein GCM10007320_34970 [Pseudorhodoferax aquiterrae]|uniref:Potassium channel domain-containing protein n=2 Tax=Pseudorhodoferax aquiterrae TaxID=747304 RepID=A0ABQ3G4E4_9BURK|nr:hypothetical protein GCM10007320_34970 [Pseudorhodoferax aquiterrae]